MSNTTKAPSKLDYEQIQKLEFNPELASKTTSGFVQGKIGHKIERAVVNYTTDDYSYFDGSNLLMTIRVTYATSSKEEVNSAERIA